MELDKYTQRLVNEWATHGKIIIGWDWDNSLSPYHTFDNNDDIKRAVALALDCQLVGCYNVIHTACREDRYDEITKKATEMGIRVDSINRTPIDMEYGKPGSKPYCNIFIDDRAGFTQALDILEEAMYKQRAKNYADRSDYPGWAG